jgi:hypothetical protein
MKKANKASVTTLVKLINLGRASGWSRKKQRRI